MRLLVAVVAVAALGSSARAVLIPGGGPPRSDCYLEFDVQAHALTAHTAECIDGDPTCDHDGACDGSCRVAVAACLNQHDPAVPNCTPPFPPTGLVRVLERGRHQVGLRIPDFASSACGALVDVDVPATRRKRTGRRIRTIAISPGRPPRDRDVLRLVCRRPPGGCASTTSTTAVASITSTSTTTTTLVTLVAPATADTGIFSGEPDATLDSAGPVFVGNDALNSERALLRFDLADVPTDATIVTCVLQVQVAIASGAGPGHAYRVKQTAWSETAATWNRYDGVHPWTTPGAFDAVEAPSDVVVTPGPDGPIAYAPPQASGVFSFPDLSPLCRDARAHRDGALYLMLKQDVDAPGPTAELSFVQRSDAPEARPQLRVGYAP